MNTMTSSINESSACSPDSTVSSLLRSCSIDSSHPYSNSLIHYKDKLYSSASQALEAYIEDFDLSLTSPDISTGKICICQSTPKPVKFSKHRAKGKQGLDDFNQLVGLGSLASPSRRQPEPDLDSASLATDDLLAFPADGSPSFVQPSPFKSRHQGSEWNSQMLQPSFCPCHTSSLHTHSSSGPWEKKKAVAHQKPPDDFSKKKCSVYSPQRHGSASSKASWRPWSFEEDSKSLPVNNYPRWLTSQKSDLSVSGITSIPNHHYPVWLKSLFSAPTEENDAQLVSTQGKASPAQSFEILKKRHSVDKDSLNFLEQNGCLDAGGDNQVEESCDCARPDASFPSGYWFARHPKKPFREDPLELLTLKADRDLGISTEDLPNTLENDGSPSTTDILGAERSWEKAPGAFDTPVPACCEDMENALPFPKADIIHKFLEDCLNDQNKENTFCRDHHHRPLEALKLMLFELQAIQGSSRRNETAEQKEEVEKLSERAEAELNLGDRERNPLTNSIQKALHHLLCLRRFVEESSSQQEQTRDREEDKQEKERRIWEADS